MNPLIADIDAEQQQELEGAGFHFVAMSWSRSVWKHPERRGQFWADEAFAAIEEGLTNE